MQQPQTNPSPAPVAKQHEYELQRDIHINGSSPGVREMLEYAKLKAAEAHASYLKLGPTPEVYARERAWLEVVRVIEVGPKINIKE